MSSRVSTRLVRDLEDTVRQFRSSTFQKIVSKKLDQMFTMVQTALAKMDLEKLEGMRNIKKDRELSVSEVTSGLPGESGKAVGGIILIARILARHCHSRSFK